MRDDNHAALAGVLRLAKGVYCAFIFGLDDSRRLAKSDGSTRRSIRESLLELDWVLRQRGGGLIMRHARRPMKFPDGR